MKIGIAGSGLAGRVLALMALRQGWQVTLFDKDDHHGHQSCGWTAAGLLTPFAEVETATSELFELGLHALDMWPDLLKDLTEPVALNCSGSLLVAHGREQAELDHFVALIRHKTQHPLTEQIQRLHAKQLQNLEPALSYRHLAYYFPREGYLHGEQFFRSTTQYLQSHCTWHTQTPVMELAPHQLTTDQTQHHFDWVFDCRGLGAKADLPTLRGVRGELIWLHAPEVRLNHPIRFLHPRYRLYIVPVSSETYIVGASEIESADFSPISVRSTLEFLSAAYSLHPGFAEARVIQSKVHCRPALPDNLPWVHSKTGLTQINGLYRHGYLLAPVVIERALKPLIGQANQS